MKKYYFNMVEIMLAIVVLALGMATVFVLFPAGMDNHKNAMAENSVADIAELVISRVRADAALAATEDDFSGAGVFPAYGTVFGSDGELDEPDWEWEDDLSATGWTFRKSSTAGFYQARQLSGPADDPYVDFTAAVVVFKDPDFDNELFVPFKDSGSISQITNFSELSDTDRAGANGVKDLSTDKMIIPLVMEISYPANVKYSERKKMYFRFEIFNEKFKLKETSGS